MSHAKTRIAASALAVAATAGILKAIATLAAVPGAGAMAVVELPRVEIVANSLTSAEHVVSATRGGRAL
jgi:hypothetical protein